MAIKKAPECIRGFLWYLQESNQGHMDFQSIALPTELRYHYVFALIKPCGFLNEKAPEVSRALLFLWYLQESNQGHMDFQSIALPTELRYQC